MNIRVANAAVEDFKDEILCSGFAAGKGERGKRGVCIKRSKTFACWHREFPFRRRVYFIGRGKVVDANLSSRGVLWRAWFLLVTGTPGAVKLKKKEP
jgi:hypothetical protein